MNPSISIVIDGHSVVAIGTGRTYAGAGAVPASNGCQGRRFVFRRP